MEIFINSLQETIELGTRLGSILLPGTVITLSGDLGAGKTTFTKGIGEGLGVKKIINSPTFTIVKQYVGRTGLSHFDAYRLEDGDYDLGFEEIFESGDVCVVEWAQFIEDILPIERINITIKKVDDDKRIFVFDATGSQCQDIIKELAL